MPTYTFRHKETNEEFEIVLRISELDDYKKQHPELTQVIEISKFISGYNLKPDNGFRDVLKRIKAANPGSNINDF